MLFISMAGLAGIFQMSLFLGIGLILFGWIEKKDQLILGGQLTFLILGSFALWLLLSNAITVPQSVDNLISKETKIIEFLRIMLIFMGLTTASFIMSLFKLRFRRAGVSLILFIALMLFFMVFSIQQMPN